jgi:hypothetical protein
MLRSWSRGNYFRTGGENQINIEWDFKRFRTPTLKISHKLPGAFL